MNLHNALAEKQPGSQRHPKGDAGGKPAMKPALAQEIQPNDCEVFSYDMSKFLRFSG